MFMYRIVRTLAASCKSCVATRHFGLRTISVCAAFMPIYAASHAAPCSGSVFMTIATATTDAETGVSTAVVEIALIAAMDENGLIGAAGGMPWHLPADLKHFKQTTLYKPILMGRRTHESIGRPLPRRRNIVLTRDPDYSTEGCECVTSLQAARLIAATDGAAQLAVIGGAQVYAQALPLAQRLYITRIHERYSGDTWFPDVDWSQWQLLSSDTYTPENSAEPACTFMEWRR